MSFQDLPHLLQLQNDLWQWPKSRATLMVGAGFSQNARPLPGVTSRFPTWRELSRSMFDQLYPPLLADSEAEIAARNEKFNRTQPLRIAGEFEAALGRERLNSIIRQRIPDTDFDPGELHQRLLELPWADVFTTNHDTLLERTEIPAKNYYLVTKAEELPRSFSPRIIKLHGSFPSQTPFIISEEDYRTYPDRFAPFVNTVQQALLENAMVLIGFSGDDPNFLAWTGWIRDELGERHAPIYLVGPLGLGNAERQLLIHRGVTPIDLAPLFPDTSPEIIHWNSINWFLRCLAAAKPPRPDQWLDFNEMSPAVPAELPPLVGSSVRIPESLGRVPNHQIPLSNEIVLKVLRRWVFERLHYPGWVILPDNKRTLLWAETKYWLGPLLLFSRDWPPADRVLLFREINWRLETAMVPLMPDTIEAFERVVNELFAALTGALVPDASQWLQELAREATGDVGTCWLEIAFGLLREARETFNDSRWKSFVTQIDAFVPQRPQFEDQRRYEHILYAAWNINRDDAKAQLVQWQPSPHSSLMNMKKAGLLAELDELGEARTILRNVLLDVRRSLRAHGQNIGLLSLEGWVTHLIFLVEQAKDLRDRTSVRDEFRERWQDLKAWDCSPWEQTEYFEHELASQPPEYDGRDKEIIGFDPGSITISKYLGLNIDPFLPAFASIRFFEQTGTPMRVPGINIAGETLVKACIWVAPFLGFWTPAILVRAGKVDTITKDSSILSRARIGLMDAELALRLHNWCLTILEREGSSLNSPIRHQSSKEVVLGALPELISIFAFKIPEADLRKSFAVAMKIHTSAVVRANHTLHDACDKWFTRLFQAAEMPLLLEWLPDLLKAPLFEDNEFAKLAGGDRWSPDPLPHFPVGRIKSLTASHGQLLSDIRNATDWLLNRALSETGIAWQRAIFRLIIIWEAHLFTEAQEQKYGEMVWGRRGANQLPDFQNMSVLGFALRLPSPQNVNKEEIVKAYIVLIDDVMTTGAHFKACKRLLLEHHPKLRVIGVNSRLQRQAH